MTDRLYYTDSYVQEFDAQILSVTTVDGRPAAILDRSAFYPTSGGQQHDTGSLNRVPVLDVQVGEDGEVREDAALIGVGHGRAGRGRARPFTAPT